MKGLAPALMALALAGCAPEPVPALEDQARRALLAVLENPVSARFDDAAAVVLEDEGLVCGGRVNFKDDWGDYTGFVPYFFHRDRGVAHPSHDAALYAALMRECIGALDSRRSSQSPNGG